MANYIYEKNARIVINTAYKFIVLIEFIIIIIFAINSFNLTSKVNEVKPLPIFINKQTGEAHAVDFNFIDAQGETRSNAEIEDYTIRFLMDLYTYNRLTVKTNLLNALSVTSKEGAVDIKNALVISKRYDNINRSLQGLVEIKSVTIIEKLPDLKVQVYFNKKLVSISGRIQEDTNHIVIIKVKPVVRKRGNAHGLVIVEYRENKIQKGGANEE